MTGAIVSRISLAKLRHQRELVDVLTDLEAVVDNLLEAVDEEDNGDNTVDRAKRIADSLDGLRRLRRDGAL